MPVHPCVQTQPIPLLGHTTVHATRLVGDSYARRYSKGSSNVLLCRDLSSTLPVSAIQVGVWSKIWQALLDAFGGADDQRLPPPSSIRATMRIMCMRNKLVSYSNLRRPLRELREAEPRSKVTQIRQENLGKPRTVLRVIHVPQSWRTPRFFPVA